MASSATSSIALAPESKTLRYYSGKISRFLLRDRTLGYLFLAPALLVILVPGRLSLRECRLSHVPVENGRRPGQMHRAGQLPRIAEQRGLLAHGLQHDFLHRRCSVR